MESSGEYRDIAAACTELKQKLSKKRRVKWRDEALEEYAKSNPKYIWESIDGEDFAETPK